MHKLEREQAAKEIDARQSILGRAWREQTEKMGESIEIESNSCNQEVNIALQVGSKRALVQIYSC